MNKPLHKYSSYFKNIGLFNDLKSFSDLEKRIIKLENIPGRTARQTKGDALEVFAEALINTSQRFNASYVYPDGKIPIKYLNKLKMNILDKGKDGIFISKNNKINSYQVKFNTNRTSLSWRKLSTFLSVSENAHERLLISNSLKIDDEFLNKRNVINFNINSLLNLSENELIKISQFINQDTEKKELPKPDPRYQVEAINKITNALKVSDRTTTVMACGSGKTLVGLWVFEKLMPKITLVLVPSIGLVKQIRSDWLGNTRLNKISSISICSSNDRSSKDDELLIAQKDLDFKITLDHKEVRKFIQKKTNDKKVIFCTYQSSRVIKKALGKNNIIDFAIFDEAHRTAKVSRRKNLNKKDLFSFALYNENIKIKKRLFMTATRRVEDRRRFNKEGDAKLSISMDNELLYGKLSYLLTFSEAAKKKIIAKSKFIISHITSNEIDSRLRKISNTLVRGNKVKTEQVADQIAIKKAANKYKIKKIFSFHHTVKQAESFCKDGPEGASNHLRKYFTSWISGEMRAKLRDYKMQEFKESNFSLMSNAKCLIEGIDVPEVSMVVFVTPKHSEIDIVQATGRALRNRNQKDKKFGYVLIPLFVEKKTGERDVDALARTDYEKLVNVIKAMREHDDEIKQIVSELLVSENRGKGYKKKALKKFEQRFDFTHPSISKKILIRHIGSKTVNSLITKWDEMFGMLLAFKDKFGHCNVPLNYNDNYDLGKWVHLIRKRRANNTLDYFKISQLEKNGFNWTLSGEERTLQHQYVNLAKVRSEHGLLTYRPLQNLAKFYKIKFINGYDYFKIKGSNKKSYIKTKFFFIKDWNKILTANNILNTSQLKEVLNKRYLDLDNFHKFCNLDKITCLRLLRKYKINADYVYLKAGVNIFKNKLVFDGMVFAKEKKKILEKKLGYKIVKKTKNILSRSDCLKLGLNNNDFKKGKDKVKETNLKCLHKANSEFGLAYKKHEIINYIKNIKNIRLSAEYIKGSNLIDSEKMKSEYYKLTGLPTNYHNAVTKKYLMPVGTGLKVGSKRVVLYFKHNEIEYYKKRILKKYNLRSNSFIFNFKDLKKKGLISEQELQNKLNCNIYEVRNLRKSKKIISKFRFISGSGSATPSYAYLILDINNFIEKYGKNVKKFKGLIPNNENLKRILRHFHNGETKVIEELIINKKIKGEGFNYLKGRFVFLLKYSNIEKYYKNLDEKKFLKYKNKIRKLIR